MYTRNCPNCDKELSYSKKFNLNKAIKSNAVCRLCSQKGKTFSEEHCRNISEALKGEKNPNYGKKGWTHSEESRRKNSIAHGGTGELNQKWHGLRAWARRAKEMTPFCEWCYSEDNLEAHHIMPKSKFPRYAYDLDNARVMCHQCHKTCHKQGGY